MKHDEEIKENIPAIEDVDLNYTNEKIIVNNLYQDVRMLYDVYMATADEELLEKCKKALTLLLARFETYMGDNGLVENPPSYMFVDWIYIDGISMHHPPKALGQTCLNMFYFGALTYAEKIFAELSMPDEAKKCKDGV